ncbi:hypothetical protein SBF1_1450002 [Candidatus Desulfosporosinus infrequens]|uniref:Nucleotidyltransferase family protein n=1 Tax=Candidatus Desulfosporosinus infrequens TaxID=2043169 RepID=A0A2U3K5R4_9FIRM|nr:hypothetical protein SBF1_1450002 [Candidatus Desulfosporosinus infrequens]
MRKFHVDCKKAVVIEATQHITVEQVLQTFEEYQITCMSLKGFLIKYLYPQPDMRMMADIDILFKNEQTESVKQLMLRLGFTLGTAKNLYRRKLFFPRLNTMKTLYPFLGTLPFLLPLCWVLRGMRCLLFKQ